MEILTEIFFDYGYIGMFVAAFLAGSVFPFSSEAVMLGMLAAGMDPWGLVLWGSAGNILGSLFNYGIGRMGRLDWLEKYFHVKPESIQKAQKFMAGRGSVMGFFAFIPILGSAITVVLGLTRANFVLSLTFIALGKILRYWLLIFGANLII